VYYAYAPNHQSFQNRSVYFLPQQMVKITFQKSSNYYNLEILLTINWRKGEGFSNLTDEEFKHNVALAKKLFFVVMYFNWFYHEGLPALKEMNLMCTVRCNHQYRIIILFWL
jgi:hypothetical protein